MSKAPPPELKDLKAYLSAADAAGKSEHPDGKTVSYYCQRYAMQVGLNLRKSLDASKQSICNEFLLPLTQ